MWTQPASRPICCQHLEQTLFAICHQCESSIRFVCETIEAWHKNKNVTAYVLVTSSMVVRFSLLIWTAKIHTFCNSFTVASTRFSSFIYKNTYLFSVVRICINKWKHANIVFTSIKLWWNTENHNCRYCYPPKPFPKLLLTIGFYAQHKCMWLYMCRYFFWLLFFRSTGCWCAPLLSCSVCLAGCVKGLPLCGKIVAGRFNSNYQIHAQLELQIAGLINLFKQYIPRGWCWRCALDLHSIHLVLRNNITYNFV